ncbi:hypothetical protein [Vibrio sp. T3Y01]|nr:hypothetical protein [Vibrio sp. T3Y01]
MKPLNLNITLLVFMALGSFNAMARHQVITVVALAKDVKSAISSDR